MSPNEPPDHWEVLTNRLDEMERRLKAIEPEKKLADSPSSFKFWDGEYENPSPAPSPFLAGYDYDSGSQPSPNIIGPKVNPIWAKLTVLSSAVECLRAAVEDHQNEINGLDFKVGSILRPKSRNNRAIENLERRVEGIAQEGRANSDVRSILMELIADVRELSLRVEEMTN